MAGELIDSLVTQLEFSADTKLIDQANKKLKALEKQSEETARATDKLADEQIRLKEKLQQTAEKEQQLRREQIKLRSELKAAKKPTDDQRKALARVDNELDEVKQSTQGYRNELSSLGIQQAKIAKQQRAEQKQIKRLTKARGQGTASIKAQNKAQNQAIRIAERQAVANRKAQKQANITAERQAVANRKAQNQASRQAATSRKSFNQGTRGSAQQTASFFKGKQARESKASAAAAASAASAGPGGLAGGLASLSAAAAPVAAVLAGVTVAATAAAGAVHLVVETGARMESLRARLKTVEGGVEQAASAFSLLRDIAKTTPFELEDVTNAYVRLKSLGIQPTEKSLKAFGNVAAAQGKPIIDFIEAVADASTGEFERLKEFGIKASSQGEQVAFTFGGMTTRVGKNAGEITQFLEGLGETKFAGAMADQMNTFNGLVSNLKDTWTGFLDQIAQLGVLDEVKMIVAEISSAMGDDLAPIIADVLVAGLRQLRDILVFVRDGGGGLAETLEGLSETIELIGAVMTPLIFVMKIFVTILRAGVTAATFLHGVLNGLLDVLAMLFDSVVTLLTPTEKATGEWTILGDAWATATTFGADLLATVQGITNSLLDQAGSLQSVNSAVKEFKRLTGDNELTERTDKELQKIRQEGGVLSDRAAQEIRKRAREREVSEKNEAKAQRKQDTAAEKKERIEGVTKRFDLLNDRQLAAFAADPSISKKIREKAEKEQIKRAKKRRTKGAAASKKMQGATLIADINKQFDKNARELAQAETARGLRSGKLDAGSAAQFETQRFKEIRDKQKAQFETTGKLPAGIAQDIRQAAALPSIQDIAGRTAPPVISNTINKFDFHDNEFSTEVTGQFATGPGEVATLALGEFRKQAQKFLGESIPNFRSQELR